MLRLLYPTALEDSTGGANMGECMHTCPRRQKVDQSNTYLHNIAYNETA